MTSLLAPIVQVCDAISGARPGARREIVEAYIQYYRHGISCVEAIGGYSKQPMNLLHTVVSSYEVQDIIDLMKDVDPDLIVNVIKTENFYGGFYQQPIE